MKKLTDQEFNVCRAVCGDIRVEGPNFRRDLNAAVRKLLANYQEQLEAESYVAVERYTEANCATTLDCNVQVAP